MGLSPADRLRRIKSLTDGSTHRVDWKRVNEASEARTSLKRARTAFVEEAASFRSLSAGDGEEPAFRSLSAVDEEELAQEAATVYRSATSSAAPTEAAFVAPPTVSDEDRQVAQALNTLKKKPKGDAEGKAHWDMAMKFGETVDTLRAKTAPAIVAQMDAAFKTTVIGTEQQPLAYLIAKGFDQSSKYMLAEAEKAEKAELAAAATEFLEQEQRVVQEAAATESAQPQADCYNSTCVICFEELPAGDTRVLKKCKHGYCNRCWDEYLDHHGHSCAVCKTSLDRSDYVRSAAHVPPEPRAAYAPNWSAEEDDAPMYRPSLSAMDDDEPQPRFGVLTGDDEDEPVYRPSLSAMDDEEPVYRSVAPEFRSLGGVAY
jgi:hypothetical protein